MGVSEMCDTHHNGYNVTGELVNVNDSYTSSSGEVYIYRSAPNSITTIFNSARGVSVTIRVIEGIPNYVLTLTQRYGNQTSGLLGNFNGDDTDDFVFRNGTRLGNDASDSEIHQFGQSCKHSILT